MNNLPPWIVFIKVSYYNTSHETLTPFFLRPVVYSGESHLSSPSPLSCLSLSLLFRSYILWLPPKQISGTGILLSGSAFKDADQAHNSDGEREDG